VVHLVRKINGVGPFKTFIESYKKYPAGIGHGLLIIYKGFGREADIVPYEELLTETPHTYLKVADFGFDLRPYFIAAKKYNYQYFCFLNSFSVIQDKDWLNKLYSQINQPNVGLVGASGSWGYVRPGQVKKNLPLHKKLVRILIIKWVGKFLGSYFDPFPNYHIRSNGFMIARDNMLKIKYGLIFSKMNAWILESGKSSITRQIEQMGLKSIVVGKDGKGYEKYVWDISNTFWRGTQENLLISDNQTRKFDMASPEWRRESELFAWGK